MPGIQQYAHMKQQEHGMADERRFFHGTPGPNRFKPGDLLTPGGGGPGQMAHVYYTSHLPSAAGYAGWGQPRKPNGLADFDADAVLGHVYEVVPETSNGKKIGRHAEDPASGLSGNAEAYRTKGRLRVLHEVDRDTGEPLEEEHTAAVVAHFDGEPEEFDHPEFGNFDDEHGLYHHPDNGWHCHACDDFHDDAETVTRHQDSYTDWDQVHPGLPEHMHRGFALQLPAELHDAVHDESAPAAQRGRMLLEHLGEDGHGTHWTPDEGQAAHYSGVSAHQNAGTWRGGNGQTHVILHARKPAIGDIETDPDTLAGQDVISFGDHDDTEIPIRSNAPVHLTGVSWRHEDTPWTRHDLPEAAEHTAELVAHMAAWDNSGSENHGVYLRFGHWPEDERSFSPAGGYHEEGVSVYDLDRHGNPAIDHGLDRGHVHDDECDVDEFGTCQYNGEPEPDNDPREEMQGRVAGAERNRHYGNDKPGMTGHLVRGEMSGVGYDGEPLLKSVRRVGDWIDHRHLFVPTAKPHRLARDPEDEDYEPPEELPHGTTAALAAGNPPCCFCGEPLDDSDVDDSASAHEECADMRWCHACDEEHEDPQEAEEHNEAYTDWGNHLPIDGGIHRGITVRLPHAVHAIVHDESVPHADRARVLAGYLHDNPHDDSDGRRGHAGGYGLHWSGNRELAQAWGTGQGAMFGIPEEQRGDPGWTHVVMHAASPDEDHIETDPHELSARNLLGYGNSRSEQEVPLRASSPVHLTGISWKRADAPDTAWQQHDLPQTHLGALEMTAGDEDEGLTWDEIGDRHPGIYGDPGIHGEAAEGADGEGIGDAAGHLAYDRPGHNYAESTGEEHPSSTGLRFYPRTVDPARIDYARSEPGDPRVRRARQGYEGQDPDRVPPLVLVHRHGVFQVADGHHRAEGAAKARKPVRAYVAYSPHQHEPFSDGERGPFHGAATEEQPSPIDAMSGQPAARITYPGFPHTAETPHPVTAALVNHFAELEPPRYHPEARCPMCGGRNYEREERPGYIPEGSRAPAYCRNCGEAFDASRSGREIAEEREREHREWEEATRNRRYNGEALFHGTRSELHPGDLLTPDEAERHRAHPDEDSRGYMHATTVGEEAYGWGERASGAETHERMTELGRGRPRPAGHSQGEAYRPRVYQVEPTGPVEYDPAGEGEAFRSAHPLRVVQEVHPLTCSHEDHEGEYHWPDHEHYEFLKQQEDDEQEDDEHEDDEDDWGHEAAAIASADEHDGDGYTVCGQGHEHWGLNGAAGLLVRHHDDDGETRYLLQHRSPYVQHGRTWSTPVGAMGSGETPEHAALREAREEMGELPGDLEHHHTVTDDHGGWSYHTVVMDSPTRFRPSGSGETDWESEGSGWFTPGEIQGLPLHPGFRSSWDKVQHSGSLRVVALDDVPAFTHRYLSPQADGGYAEREELVQGPFYHGSRSRRLGEGAELAPGRKTNGWGDEGAKSQWVHFTTDLGGAAEYARQAGGHVYEVEPHGDVQMGYSGSEWKSKGTLRVRRVVPPEEIASHQARTGQLIVAANVADHVLTRGAPIPAAADVHAAIGAWMPQNAREVHECLDEFPLLFQALHEGLAALARELEGSPVSVHLIAIVRRMAACCQGAAEDAMEVAGRPLDGAEGMWEGSRASVGPKA
jgi:8-oxo-dGTP diphosphatase